MPHHAPLIAAIVIGLVLAFILGAIANRFRISPLVGYLLAGVMVGPGTPGLVIDQGLTNQLAEIGVILLMFGVGLHFSLKDLLSVKAIAIPGAVAQIAIATLLGVGLSYALGWSLGAGLVFGLALSVASTVVLLRALQERRLVETERGRIAVGWLIVEDLAMVLALVMLPAMAGFLVPGEGGAADPSTKELAIVLAITIGKVAAFVAFMLIVGRRVIPWLLHYIAHTGSRELFRLAVLAIALGVAYGAALLFDVSFALGAFFAGMMLAESELSSQAASETLPLRDAFAVLFFVSVGMLVDPMIVVREWWPVLATVLIIVLGKSIAAFLIVRAFGHGTGTALTISASLAQIGEFSFILAGLGVALGIIPDAARDLILAGAILSIFLNPFAFTVLDRLKPWIERRDGTDGMAAAAMPEAAVLPRSILANHAVIVGYGRVGSAVGEALTERGQPYLVVEERKEIVDALRARGTETILGPLPPAALVEAANVAQARWMFVAVPNGFEAGQIVAEARQANPALEIVARAHSDAEVEHLSKLGAQRVIMGEREIARGMVDYAFGDVPAALA
ncbi:MAG: Kef family K(+) transporter [Alphaproteobacteria bacterium]|nr:Kef family K(+) transporter [Alphaproteobacteria bacterium]